MNKDDAKNPVAAAQPKLLDAVTYALEFTNHNGPFDLEENFQRYNGFLRYYAVRGEDEFTLTAQAFSSRFDSPDQIPQRAIEQGLISRFGSLDTTVGGRTQRYSLDLAWKRSTSDGGETRAQIYGIYYDLDLFSNFTYFLDDPVNGDQFNQADSRFILGGSVARIWNAKIFGRDATFTLGLDTRTDLLDDVALNSTREREILSTTREDDVLESSAGLYGQPEVRWTNWLRSILGVRADGYFFDVENRVDLASSGDKFDGIVSPKASLIFGPFAKTELYLSGGTGFHSNDARGVIGGIDPATGENALPADALARSIGGEAGVRTSFVPGLVSSLAFFYLQSDSELVFVGDAGSTEPSGATERYGIEFNNFYRRSNGSPRCGPRPDQRALHGRGTGRGRDSGRDPDLGRGGRVDRSAHRFFASFRGRYFGRRPLIEDNSVKSKDSLIFNARAGYRFKKPEIEVAVQVLNVFDAEDNDIEYFYASRLPGEPAEGVEDIHLRASAPLSGFK